MENSISFQPLVDLIQTYGHVSEELIKCHSLICHHIPIDHFSEDVQAALSGLFDTAQALKSLESELFPPENERISELEKMLEESRTIISKLIGKSSSTISKMIKTDK